MIQRAKDPAKRKQYFLVVGDALVIGLAFLLAFFARTYLAGESLSSLVQRVGIFGPVFAFPLYIIVFYVFGLYDLESKFSRARSLMSAWLAVLFVLVVVSALSFFLQLRIEEARMTPIWFSRSVLLIHTPFVAVGAYLWRILFLKFFLPIRRRNRVALVGFDSTIEMVLRDFESLPVSGYEFVGIVSPCEDNSRGVHSLPILTSDATTLPNLLAAKSIDTLVYCLTAKVPNEFLSAVLKLKYTNELKVYDFPTFYSSLTGKVPIYHVGNEWLLLASNAGNAQFPYKYLKRLLDILISCFVLVFLAPLMALITLAIKLDSKGPTLCRQIRIGHNRKPFSFIKFRTMIDDAEQEGPVWAQKNDPRVTRVGKFLRSTGLDELPQAFNILKSEMSIVGYRPIREVFEKEAEAEIPFYSLRYSLRPGVTGWAQVMYQAAREREGPLQRFQYDMFYIQNASFSLDLLIIVKTLKKIVERGF